MTDSGYYILLIRLPEKTTIKIGAKKETDFPAGWYVYTGSSARSLSKRVQRHAAENKKLHWHIDYLLATATLYKTWIIKDPRQQLRTNHSNVGLDTTLPFECALARKLSQVNDGEKFFAGFGSGDCRCDGHLSYFHINPEKYILKEFENHKQIRLISRS